MEIYKNNKASVRTIEEKDRNSILYLVTEEDFGCKGNFKNNRPTRENTELFINSILKDNNPNNQALIIEEHNQFKGYALVSKITPKSYFIYQFAILKEERNQGYGSLLIDVIKSSAKQENCMIQTMAYSTEAIDFYTKHGIYDINNSENNISLYGMGIFKNTNDLLSGINIVSDESNHHNYNM